MRPFAKLVSISLLALGASVTGSFAMDSTLRSHPDTATARFYEQHEADVDGLLNRMSDTARPIAERLAAFNELQIAYPDAANLAALDLVSDLNEQMAVAAAELLSSSITMSDHSAQRCPSPKGKSICLRGMSVPGKRCAARSMTSDARLGRSPHRR